MLCDNKPQKQFDIIEHSFRNTRIMTYVIDIITHTGISYLKGRTYFEQTKICVLFHKDNMFDKYFLIIFKEGKEFIFCYLYLLTYISIQHDLHMT